MAESIVAAPIIPQLDPYELPDGGELDEPSGASRLTDSRLVGFSLGEGKVDDLRVVGGTMMLCSFAHSALRRVAFENVNLREASFLETRLTSVSFSGCDLTGADFRGARLKECTIRGSSRGSGARRSSRSWFHQRECFC
jgi:uncharacterized protein YjbI with pentapeptide repeats